MNSGSLRWLLQRISGIVLILLLLGHFAITHYFPGGEVTYEKVVLRLSQPFWKFLNLTFLVLCLYHGLNGSWSVLEDYLERGWLRITLFGVLMIGGLALLSLGALTILAFQPKV